MMRRLLAIPFAFFQVDTTQASQQQDNISVSRAYLLFWFGVVLHIGIVYIALGDALLSGQFWAEGGTRYFASSHKSFSQLMITDSGYLAFPQRLISLLTYTVGAPASWAPYIYNGAAISLTALWVFTFCLPHFRVVISSDSMRFLLCLVLGFIGGFKVREFINFTYYGALFVTYITSLAVANRTVPLPKWVWPMPLLFVAKPAILATLPAMMLALPQVGKSARWLFALCLGGAIFQFCFSTGGGANDISLADRLHTLLDVQARHIIGIFFRQEPLMPTAGVMQYIVIAVAISVMGVLLVLAYRWKTPEKILLLLGMMLMFFADVIVTFGLVGEQYALWKSMTHSYPIMRWSILQAFGSVLIIAAVSQYVMAGFRHSAAILMGLWLLVSGWGVIVNQFYKETYTMQIVSWQHSANAIHDPEQSACIAVAPYGWMFRQGECRQLHKTILTLNERIQPHVFYEAEKPEAIQNTLVYALVFPFSIVDFQQKNYHLTLEVNGNSYDQTISRRSDNIRMMAVQFTLPQPLPAHDIASVRIMTDAPIKAVMENDKAQLTWYGEWR